MRTYLANQALESGKPLAREFLGRSPNSMSAYGSGGMLLNPESAQANKTGMQAHAAPYLDMTI